jgi:hypothetical protein
MKETRTSARLKTKSAKKENGREKLPLRSIKGELAHKLVLVEKLASISVERDGELTIGAE